MSAILINLGPTASATTIWSAKVDDAQVLSVVVNTIAGSTLVVESSPDNSTWTAVPTGLNVTSGAPGTNVSSGTITAIGRYVFQINNTYVRVRVSSYVGPGNVDVYEDLSNTTLRTVTRPIDNGLVATGSTQATALPLQAVFNRFATVAASTGCILPDVGNLPLYEVIVRNQGANSINVYPPVGKSINGGAVNTAVSPGAGTITRFVSDTSGNYWSF